MPDLEFAQSLLATLNTIDQPRDPAQPIAPTDFDEIEIEILPKGTHTSSNGYVLEVSDAQLDEVVSSYDPTYFQAPLILGHDTKGLADGILAKSEFAYGAPKALRRDGDKVKAVFDKVSTEFVQWVKNGNLLSVSPSFYLPNSPSNPTPGKLSLRHIAALGDKAPSIKGQQSLQAAFASFSEAKGVVDFSFDATDRTVEFCGCNGYPKPSVDRSLNDRVIARAFQSLREWVISEHGLETADRILPLWDINALLEAASESANHNYQEVMTTELEKTKAELDFAERESQLAERERQLAEKATTLLKQEFASFCASDLKGKLTPAIAPQSEVVEFMGFLASQGSIDFSEDKTESPLDWFKGFLTRLPTQVHFGEFAATEAPAQSVQTSAEFSAEEVAADREIRKHMAQHNVNYVQAMTALGYTY